MKKLLVISFVILLAVIKVQGQDNSYVIDNQTHRYQVSQDYRLKAIHRTNRDIMWDMRYSKIKSHRSFNGLATILTHWFYHPDKYRIMASNGWNGRQYREWKRNMKKK